MPNSNPGTSPFNKKIVWITGASSGIGKAVAKVFFAQGARLILSSRNLDSLMRVKAELGGKDDNILLFPLDLENFSEVEKRAVELPTNWSAVDVLVNNAGVSQRGTALDTPLEVVQRILDTNFMGTIALTRAVLPGMRERRRGSIVVISSVTGKTGTPMRSAYAASKHALHGWFDSLRAEEHANGIHVLLVCPGYIRTDVSINALGPDGKPTKKMDENQKNGLDPEILAHRILRATTKKKSEIYEGGKEIAAIYLKRWMPRLLERLLERMGRPQ